MAEMALELDLYDIDVNWVIVNMTGAESTQQGLIDECGFPIFQDVAEIGAWGQHGGDKDDILIYDAEGKLGMFLPYPGGDVDINLASADGYQNLLYAISVVAGQELP